MPIDVHMTFTGVRDDAEHYLRTLPRFETAMHRGIGRRFAPSYR
jgi:hypothetical protein